MLTIRLERVGKKNKAQFRIVLQEHTVAPGGRHVEVLGSYDPHSKQFSAKEDRVKYWVGKGAQLSDTVHNLMVSKRIITGEERKVKVPARIATQSVAGGSAKKAEAQKMETKAEEKPAEDKTVVEKTSKSEVPKEEKKEEEKK